MRLVQINRSPNDSQLQQFGLISLLALPGIAWFWNAPQQILGALIGTGLLLAIIGFVRPRVLKPVFIGLSCLTIPIGLIVSELALLLVYAGVFLPIGMVFRLTKRDSLQLQAVPVESYWRKKSPPSGVASYYRQW